MLCSIKRLEGSTITASDGRLGHVADILFDDHQWVIRHLVVDCGNWLPGRKVLISPRSVELFDTDGRRLDVSLSQAQVKNSPDLDTDAPVSRQREAELADYYGYATNWGGVGYWGGDMVPNPLLPGYGGFGSPEAIREQDELAGSPAGPLIATSGDPHLRSGREVMRYHVHAKDGDIGHVDDMLIDDRTWAIRYLVVDTSNWWLGHRVLIAPAWITNVSWPDSAVSIHLTRKAIEKAAPYDPATTLSRLQEADLYRHYDRPPYWNDHRLERREATLHEMG